MPMSDWAYGPDAWHLVNYVRSLSSDTQRQRVEMKKFTIHAARVNTLPDHPDSSIWGAAIPINLHLMPLWWRSDRPEEVTVRALHDSRDIALLMVWQDDTNDQTALRPPEFPRRGGGEFLMAPNSAVLCHGSEKRAGEHLDVEIGTSGGSRTEISRSGKNLSQSWHRFLSQSPPLGSGATPPPRPDLGIRSE